MKGFLLHTVGPTYFESTSHIENYVFEANCLENPSYDVFHLNNCMFVLIRMEQCVVRSRGNSSPLFCFTEGNGEETLPYYEPFILILKRSLLNEIA
ncbi:hypothetical protein A0J61_08775 [Choanephora cucurbitarum]|uniref:Uncharacterized protein n=1 Tax=Choanephora cucurbitarum TaxID=101091 RepID=A0A1C7N766_9FUNG|nr:hypothetical protein A0J61_08775 [Choanephora cucurbitarum]